MADAINLFDARRSKWSEPDGSLTREAQIFVRDLWRRAGGAMAASNNDLSASQFEDAGIEEIKASVFALGDAATQNPAPAVHVTHADEAPTQVPEQRIEALETLASEQAAQLAELRKQVSALQESP